MKREFSDDQLKIRDDQNFHKGMEHQKTLNAKINKMLRGPNFEENELYAAICSYVSINPDGYISDESKRDAAFACSIILKDCKVKTFNMTNQWWKEHIERAFLKEGKSIEDAQQLISKIEPDNNIIK